MDRPLDDIEVQQLHDMHKGVTVPIAGNPQQRMTLCLACGDAMPCRTLRLLSEVKRLRISDYRHGASLHER